MKPSRPVLSSAWGSTRSLAPAAGSGNSSRCRSVPTPAGATAILPLGCDNWWGLGCAWLGLAVVVLGLAVALLATWAPKP